MSVEPVIAVRNQFADYPLPSRWSVQRRTQSGRDTAKLVCDCADTIIMNFGGTRPQPIE
jgi:hypothetical protein